MLGFSSRSEPWHLNTQATLWYSISFMGGSGDRHGNVQSQECTGNRRPLSVTCGGNTANNLQLGQGTRERHAPFLALAWLLGQSWASHFISPCFNSSNCRADKGNDLYEAFRELDSSSSPSPHPLYLIS